MEGHSSPSEHQHTRQTFDRPDVVAFYEDFDHLLPCEELVFGWAVPPGARLLDLGVGAGRTSGPLSAKVGPGRYVGLDYAAGMVAAATQRKPTLPFVQGDASTLPFRDAAFDVVVFSFNGLDCIHPAERRREAIAEIARVLAPGGRAIVSGHDPRAFIAPLRPLRGVPLKIAAYRVFDWVRRSAARAALVLRSEPFRRGEGYYLDPEHGGNRFHAATPTRFPAPFESAGFRLVGGPVAADHPRRPSRWRSGWHYYVFDQAAPVDRFPA